MKHKINPTWRKVLNVSAPRADKQKWSLYPIGRIKRSFDLNTFTKIEASEVTKYLKANIKAQEQEIVFLKKWSPRVYHKNTYWSLELENQTMRKVLSQIAKALKTK